MFETNRSKRRGVLDWTRLEIAHEAGLSPTEIARKTGLSISHVARMLKRYRGEAGASRLARRARLMEMEIARVEYLYLSGDIAESRQRALGLAGIAGLRKHRAVLLTGEAQSRPDNHDPEGDTDADGEYSDGTPEAREALCRDLILAAEARGEIEAGSWQKILEDDTDPN